MAKKHKNKNKKRRQEEKPSNTDPREPVAVAQADQPVQLAPVTKVKYESGLDAILRRARERALQQLRERAVSGR